MRFSAAYMISFSDNFPIAYDDCSYHWVRGGIAKSVLCQLYTATHVFFFFHVCYLSMIILTFALRNRFFVVRNTGFPVIYPISVRYLPSPYHLRIYTLGLGTDLTRTWSHLGPVIELTKNPPNIHL